VFGRHDTLPDEFGAYLGRGDALVQMASKGAGLRQGLLDGVGGLVQGLEQGAYGDFDPEQIQSMRTSMVSSCKSRANP